jgi:predicted NBD/HSP70 family sugar kinase
VKRIDLKNTSVARSNTIRDINRQIVLNFVREKGPISRAEIARETNLQRSTISLIVTELRNIGLIDEVYGDSSGGRPPALLTLPTSQPIAIGVDLGTKRTVVATCDLTGRIINRAEFPTDRSAKRTTSLIVDHVKNYLESNGDSIEGIGISIPALVDAERRSIRYSPHFEWQDPQIVDQLEKATGISVTVDNDANAAAMAELWFGRPEIQGVRDFVLVYIENGIGTGIVLDGQIYRGRGGVAGEFGHMRIGTDAPVACPTGSRECWEAFASERAALARYKEMKSGNNGSPITFSTVVQRAFDGDQHAIDALKQTAEFIGIGVANLIQGLSPDAVVIGGEFVEAWAIISQTINDSVRRVVCNGVPSARIIPSTLGKNPTLMGAFSLVLANKFASVSI